MVIEGDGRSFEPDAHVEGFGIPGMRERVALPDDRLQIESEPERGTTLVSEVEPA